MKSNEMPRKVKSFCTKKASADLGGSFQRFKPGVFGFQG